MICRYRNHTYKTQNYIISTTLFVLPNDNFFPSINVLRVVFKISENKLFLLKKYIYFCLHLLFICQE